MAGGSATATPARSTPAAAITDSKRTPLISPEHRIGGFEDRGRHRLAALEEVVEVDGPLARSAVHADGIAFGVDRGLPELEQLLELRLAVDQTRDLGDADDLSRAAAHALGLHDDVDRGGDLLLDRAGRQVVVGHQDHGLQAAASCVCASSDVPARGTLCVLAALL